MASAGLVSFKRLAAYGYPTRSLLTTSQRRYARVQDVRLLATVQQPRATLEKYREKLETRAKQEGHQDIEELREAYAEKIKQVRRGDAVTSPGAPLLSQKAKLPEDQGPPTPSRESNRTISSTAQTSSSTRTVKPLSSILDLPKVRSLPDKELSAVWRLRHASSPSSLCAVIPASTYTAMETAARAAPQFVLPVPHPEQGAEIHFLQWTFDPPTNTSTVLFTQLAEYKARGEFAQPHMTVTHYTDLMDDRALVLMHGQVADGRGATLQTATFLVMCLQKFYGAWDGPGSRRTDMERKRLLEWFANGDHRFSIDKLMEETEKL
jgi:ATP synthase F1 complex assembly factor 1